MTLTETMTKGVDPSLGTGNVFGKRPNVLTHLLSQNRPLIMGVLNVTPDSFSDGGHHASTASAVAHARALVSEGATLVDIANSPDFSIFDGPISLGPMFHPFDLSDLPNAPVSPEAQRWLVAVAKDLVSHRGRAVALADSQQPAPLHAVA